MLLTNWLDARKQQPCKMCNKTSLVMNGLLHKYWLKNLPGGEALMLKPFIALLGLIPGGTSPSCKTANNLPRCRFLKVSKCQMSSYPPAEIQYDKISCQVMKLSNLQSCRAADRSICRAAKLPSCQAA